MYSIYDVSAELKHNLEIYFSDFLVNKPTIESGLKPGQFNTIQPRNFQDVGIKKMNFFDGYIPRAENGNHSLFPFISVFTVGGEIGININEVKVQFDVCVYDKNAPMKQLQAILHALFTFLMQDSIGYTINKHFAFNKDIKWVLADDNLDNYAHAILNCSFDLQKFKQPYNFTTNPLAQKQENFLNEIRKRK